MPLPMCVPSANAAPPYARLQANDAGDATPHQAGLPPDLANADPIATGSTAEKLALAPQSTLKLEDLIPAWKAPKPRKG